MLCRKGDVFVFCTSTLAHIAQYPPPLEPPPTWGGGGELSPWPRKHRKCQVPKAPKKILTTRRS